MKQLSHSVVLAVSLLGISSGCLGQASPVLKQGTVVVSQAELKLVTGGDYGTLRSNGGSLVVDTVRPVQMAWGFQIGTAFNKPVKEGDILMFRVEARALKGQPETGEAGLTLDFTTGGPDYRKSLLQPVSVGKKWQTIYAPFRVSHAQPAGGSLVNVWLGTRPQSLEIRNFQLLSFPSGTDFSKLPKTKITYQGMEADATWRKTAEARIEKLRKGNVEFVIVDGKNRPVKGAQVRIEQTKHEFHFGTAVACDYLVQPGADNDKYREIFLKYFNQAATENHLKWPFWEEWGRADGLKALEWLGKRNIPIRAHNVIWPGWSNLPADLPGLKNNPAALRKRIDDRIKDITDATRGKVFEWDVANETFANHDLMDILGWDALGEWFSKVKKADPKPRLTLNDYPSLDGAGTNDPHLNDFYKTIWNLKKSGAPIEAIGFQCHVGANVVPPTRVLSGLDRFAAFKLPIVITEFDIETQDRELQAAYMRDFLTATFSHPSVVGITQWGFWQGRHWMPSAGLWDQQWNLRPHGKAYLDLVFGKWWTKTSGQTSASGTLGTRAFYGDYRVTVKLANGKSVVWNVRVGKSGPRKILIQAG